MDFVKKSAVKELTVIFFTDGEDTSGSGGSVNNTLEEMTGYFKGMSNHFKTRLLSIGFGASHDAPFMNRIAKAGSEMGNFFYIDTSGNYTELVTKCLSESLDIAMEGSGQLKLQVSDGLKLTETLGLETTYNFAEQSAENEDDAPVITGVSLSCQTIMQTKVLQDLKADLFFKDKKFSYNVSFTLVENPSQDILLKARLQNANANIFKFI